MEANNWWKNKRASVSRTINHPNQLLYFPWVCLPGGALSGPRNSSLIMDESCESSFSTHVQPGLPTKVYILSPLSSHSDNWYWTELDFSSISVKEDWIVLATLFKFETLSRVTFVIFHHLSESNNSSFSKGKKMCVKVLQNRQKWSPVTA